LQMLVLQPERDRLNVLVAVIVPASNKKT